MAEQYVLEIGPGIGTMTQYLCEKARQVVAVEVDQKLILVLEETLSGNDNVMVLNEDVLKVDIIMGLFEAHVPLESITVMVQKEVAERMQAAPGTKGQAVQALEKMGLQPDVRSERLSLQEFAQLSNLLL